MLTRLAATTFALLAFAGSVAAEVEDVPRDHWAYDAVQELAQKGMVLGYPDGDFLGERTLTRYEMATLVQRILRHVGMHGEQGGNSGAGPTPITAPATPGAGAEDIDSIRRLVDEYKVELTVMGTDLKQVRDEVAALRADVDQVQEDLQPIKSQVLDPEGALSTVVSDVSKLKKIKISGYVQARLTDAEDDDTEFTVRRARLKAQGMVGNRTSATFQMDAGGSDKNSSVTLKDAYLEYFVKGIPDRYPTVSFGQFKWPFGYQIPQSSSDRETPERADVLRALFPGERDRGIKVSAPGASRAQWEIGVFNGVGIDQKKAPWYSDNYNDNNNHKDIAGHLRYAVSDTLAINASGYWGKAGPDGMLQDRTRWGADLQWYGVSVPLSIKAEYVRGKEPTGAADAPVSREPWGWYAQAAYSFSPLWTGVYMYDVYDDDGASSAGRRKNHNAGLIRYLDDTTRLKLFYQWRQESAVESDNNVTTLEWITRF